MQSIIHKPTLYLQEVQEHLYSATGKWVSAVYNLSHHKGKGVHSKEGTGHSIATEQTMEDRLYGTSCSIIQSRYVHLDLSEEIVHENMAIP